MYIYIWTYIYIYIFLSFYIYIISIESGFIAIVWQGIRSNKLVTLSSLMLTEPWIQDLWFKCILWSRASLHDLLIFVFLLCFSMMDSIFCKCGYFMGFIFCEYKNNIYVVGYYDCLAAKWLLDLPLNLIGRTFIKWHLYLYKNVW